MRWANVAVGFVALVACMSIATRGALADPPPTGKGFGGHNGAGRVHIDGSAVIAGEGSRPSTSNAPPIFTLKCGTSVEPVLKSLGDLSPALTGYTCDEQAELCLVTGALDRRHLDAVVTVTPRSDGTWQYLGNDCVGAAPPRVTPELVRQQVVRLIPSAKVGIAPKGTTLVNIETVLWADAPRQRDLAPVTLLGQRVTISLVLDHVAWSFGDGTSASGPAGKAYDATGDPCRTKTCDHYFGHVYRKSGTVHVNATASWRASFRVGGAGPQDIPGTVAGPASAADVVVKQARAVLVPNPGDKP